MPAGHDRAGGERAAGELVREDVAEVGQDPAVLSALDDVIAVAAHALTAVIDSGAIVGSEVADTHFLGIHRRAGQGDDGRHAGAHGHDGQGDGGHAGAGGFGHH